MKAAICSAGSTLDSPFDPRFGRCAYFVIVDTDTLEFTADPNPGATMGQGAGVVAAQLVCARGVEAVVAGNFGPNAFQALASAGIRVYTCAAATVRQALEELKKGALPAVGSPTVASHFGMGVGGGAGRGMGRGRGGRGGGGGRGRGRW